MLQLSSDIEDRISAIALFLREWNKPYYTRGRPGTEMADIERDVQYALKMSSWNLRNRYKDFHMQVDAKLFGSDRAKDFFGL